MKITTIAATVLMLTGGAAMAAEEATNPLPEGGTSGRPSAVLSESQCNEVWKAAGAEGDSLSKEQARDYVLNFKRVDADDNKKVSQEEFQKGCSKGWVHALADVKPVTGDSDSKAAVNPGKPNADIN